jgi:predicted metal-dependent enzyme (double-stranded beta helix superfamily)
MARDEVLNHHDHDDPTAAGEDEYVLDNPTVRKFITEVRAAISRAAEPAEALEAIRPDFARLLEGTDWLPAKYQAEAPESGMGGGIGQWLLFRSGARDLCLFSLVVPPGVSTPVHNHLAWGLVGLYRGEQEETIFARRTFIAPIRDHEELSVASRRTICRGDFYPLLPPTEDIHCVRTTSMVNSVSIHLLTNDTGCVWRHAYYPETAEGRPFRSGYANRACEPEESTSSL